MSFGDRLKQYREDKGFTQEQLAGMIGVAKTTITGYERGNRTPDVDKIKKHYDNKAYYCRNYLIFRHCGHKYTYRNKACSQKQKRDKVSYYRRPSH